MHSGELIPIIGIAGFLLYLIIARLAEAYEKTNQKILAAAANNTQERFGFEISQDSPNYDFIEIQLYYSNKEQKYEDQQYFDSSDYESEEIEEKIEDIKRNMLEKYYTWAEKMKISVPAKNDIEILESE